MSGKLDLYDFFSYLIPGSIYLIASLLILYNFDNNIISILNTSSSSFNLTLGFIISYIFGRLGGDFMYKYNPIYYFFISQKLRDMGNDKKKELQKIVQDYLPKISTLIENDDINFESITSFIFLKNEKLMSSIDRQMVLRIFSRNLSLSLLFMSVALIIKGYYSIAILSIFTSVLFLVLILKKYGPLYFRMVIDGVISIAMNEQLD